MQGMENITLLTAFTGGLLSFFSPCVLPLIPVYLSFVSGLTFEQMTEQTDRKKTFFTVFFNTLLFVLGFSCVFVLLGVGASSIGLFLQTYQRQVSLAAGLVILVLALHFIGVLRIKYFYYEKRMQVKERRFGPISSFLLGFAFAFGWTPCIGPILASILLLASQQSSMMAGVGLLAVYSAGLAIPFLATAIFLNTFLGFFSKMNKHFETIELVIGGVLLIAATWLIFSQFTYIFPAWYAMAAVAAVMFVVIIFAKKLPKTAFNAIIIAMVFGLTLGGGGLYFFSLPPAQSDDLNAHLIAFDDFAGNPKYLKEFEGKPILLNFFASWCSPCKKEIPELIKINSEKAQGNFYIVGINCDEDIEDGKKIISELGIPYPVFHGKISDVQTLGERTALPTNMILNAEGKKVQSFTGFPGEDLLLEKMNSLVAQEGTNK